MQRFSLDRRRFAGHPRRGFPHPSGGSPSPSKSPPKGGDPTPQGAGVCRPPCQPFGLPFDPPGHPYGVPPASPAPPPVRSGSEGGKRSAQGVSPERGWKKSKWWRRLRPQAASGGNVGKAGQPVGRGGGSRWAAPGCPRGVPAPVHGPRSAGRSRSDLHISTAGGPTRPPLGACSAPQGSRLPFRKSSEYTCLSSDPPEARF